MKPDPHAPTPGTENEPEIDYDAIEKRMQGRLRLTLPVLLLLALVRKARQRDEAEKEIEARIATNGAMTFGHNGMAQVACNAETYGLSFALDLLRKA